MKNIFNKDYISKSIFFITFGFFFNIFLSSFIGMHMFPFLKQLPEYSFKTDVKDKSHLSFLLFSAAFLSILRYTLPLMISYFVWGIIISLIYNYTKNLFKLSTFLFFLFYFLFVLPLTTALVFRVTTHLWSFYHKFLFFVSITFLYFLLAFSINFVGFAIGMLLKRTFLKID